MYRAGFRRHFRAERRPLGIGDGLQSNAQQVIEQVLLDNTACLMDRAFLIGYYAVLCTSLQG